MTQRNGDEDETYRHLLTFAEPGELSRFLQHARRFLAAAGDDQDDPLLVRLAAALLDLDDVEAREAVVRFVESAADLPPDKLRDLLKLLEAESVGPTPGRIR
ncbi:MAG: hypothetical protein V2A76_09240 [Planctomycetota bacterium]